MQIGNLAFLQNFYTDVTLLIPAEDAAPVAVIPAAPAVVAPAVVLPEIAPAAVLPTVAVSAPPLPPAPAPPLAPRPLVAPARLPENSPALQNLPRLSPPPGTTPPALTVSGSWDASILKARLTWPASTAPNLVKLQVRGCTGGSYKAGDEEIIADFDDRLLP